MSLPLQENERYLYDNYAEFRAHKWLLVTVSPLLLLLGTCGNVLSAWGLYDGQSTSSTFVYLIVIGLADQVTLMTGLGKRWLNSVFGLQLERASAATCAATHFVLTYASCLSVFCLATVAVERFAIVWPCKRLQSAIGGTRRCVSLLLVVCLLLNIHWLVALDLVPYQDEAANGTDIDYVCDLRPQFRGLKSLLAWYDFLLYSLSPLCVLLACNCVILKRLHSTRRVLGAAAAKESFKMSSRRWNHGDQQQLQPLQQQHQQQVQQPQHQHQTGSRQLSAESRRRQNRLIDASRRSRSIRQVTVMLLLVSFFFLATSLPITVLKVLISLLGEQLIQASPETHVKYRLVETSAKLLMYTNHSANFYLYCLVGRRFRRGLRAKLRRLARRIRFH